MNDSTLADRIPRDLLDAEAGGRPLRPLAALVEEIADLKRVRAAHLKGSWAAWRFGQAWATLLDCWGDDAAVLSLAINEAARAVAAARLGAITPGQLREGKLGRDAIVGVFQRSVREQGGVPAMLLPTLLSAVQRFVDDDLAGRPDRDEPSIAEALRRQPRAGATCPGKARVLLDPPESHADHCYVVAVCGVLAAAGEGADPVRPFLFGLTHHLHNVTLADSGFAGEVLLGDDLDRVIDALFETAFRQLPGSLADAVRTMRPEFAAADTADARAFHTADVLDRVAEMRHFERAATFAAQTALHDLDLVHAGPTQAFGQHVLRSAGWWAEPAN